MSTNTPNQKLTIYLMKQESIELEGYMDTKKRLTRHELQGRQEGKGAVFVGPQSQNPPRWVNFLETGTEGTIGRLMNSSTSAVLFVMRKNRVFALSYGYGSAFLKNSKIERGFGMHVVANVVDPDSIRSLDTKVVQELTVYSRKQTSDSAGLSEFGIDPEEDLLDHIVGIPKDKKFASLVSGADSLQMTVPVTFSGLWPKCDQILAAYNGKNYKKIGFEFIDHVFQINDNERCAYCCIK